MNRNIKLKFDNGATVDIRLILPKNIDFDLRRIGVAIAIFAESIRHEVGKNA